MFCQQRFFKNKASYMFFILALAKQAYMSAVQNKKPSILSTTELTAAEALIQYYKLCTLYKQVTASSKI